MKRYRALHLAPPRAPIVLSTPATWDDSLSPFDRVRAIQAAKKAEAKNAAAPTWSGPYRRCELCREYPPAGSRKAGRCLTCHHPLEESCAAS